MAENKKEMERTELHRTIWAIADEMRGAVDGWDFKAYILGMLFYRYISENITNYINKGEWDTGNTDFDYATLDDATAESIREEMVGVKGFFILPSQLFCNVCKVCDKDANLNETLEKIFNSIEASAKGTESEDDFNGLFADVDVNSNKLGATVIKPMVQRAIRQVSTINPPAYTAEKKQRYEDVTIMATANGRHCSFYSKSTIFLYLIDIALQVYIPYKWYILQ